MQKFLILLVSCILTACTTVKETPPMATGQESSSAALQPRMEETGEDEVVAPPAATGSTVAERLLATGILEIGEANAPLTLLLFTEHHARYCREFQRDMMPRLVEEFVEPGVLRLQVVILPLKKYPQSQTAAAALLCAAEQERGFDLHDILSDKLDRERLEPRHYAEELKLDMELFDECLADEGTALVLEQQRTWSHSLAVSLVPTFFLNGEKLVGLPYYADLKGMIGEQVSE